MEDHTTSVIRIRGLRTQFGAAVVHDGLDLDVHEGEVLGIVGGSGSGKSVLLRAMIGLLKPTAGRIEILGQDLARPWWDADAGMIPKTLWNS